MIGPLGEQLSSADCDDIIVQAGGVGAEVIRARLRQRGARGEQIAPQHLRPSSLVHHSRPSPSPATHQAVLAHLHGAKSLIHLLEEPSTQLHKEYASLH